jgi:hypothetical protein
MAGIGVDGRTSVTTLSLASLALAAATLLVGGCSSSTDPIFPAVHDMPAPRPEAPLTADQVKAATDDLITQREHLSTEVQTAAQPAPPAKTAGTKTAGTKTAGTKTANTKTVNAKTADTKISPPKKPPYVPQAAPDTTATVTPTPPAAQTAGAYSKPQ